MEDNSEEWESSGGKRSSKKGKKGGLGIDSSKKSWSSTNTPYKKSSTLGYVETPDGVRHSSRKGKRPVRLEPTG